MKKRAIPLFLTLALCLGLSVPALAAPAEESLPDWYFLFAIFKNVDADCADGKGVTTHTKYTMTQEEVDIAYDNARQFETYMNQLGVMRAHMEIVEIDTPITELAPSDTGSYLGPNQAAPLLEDKVDLDRYDQVTCTVSLNVATGYLGKGGTTFENGTAQSCINLRNQEYAQRTFVNQQADYPKGTYVHELLHFVERTGRKWGVEFDLHAIREQFYMPTEDDYRSCYTDIILNRVEGTAETGTGVAPAAWQYPPRVFRTMSAMTVPDGVSTIGSYAFYSMDNLEQVIIPSSVTSIEERAFRLCSNLSQLKMYPGVETIGQYSFTDCTALTEVMFPAGVASIGTWSFGNCTALSRVSIPASITSIGYAAFWNTGLKEVYYAGTEDQWKAIQIGEFNAALTDARIYYNSLMADVRVDDYYAGPVTWAMETGVAAGTGNGTFSPGSTCSKAQILTFLWRAGGSPKPAGSNPFSDVTSGDYYADAAAWAYENGLVSGGTFDGNDPCTRSMAVTYMWRAAGSPAAGAAGFTDVAAGADYAQAVAWAVERNITAGTAAAAFSPDDACTRGQIVTFLWRNLVQSHHA